MASRWRPSQLQHWQANDVLTNADLETPEAFTLHLLVNKHYGIWNQDVEVVHVHDFVFCDRDSALRALQLLTKAYARTHRKHVCGGYARHTLSPDHQADPLEPLWAVWDDICSEFDEKGAPVR